MSEYTELTAKIEALEKRVKYLEDTFATLADMNKSGEMAQYIAQRQRALVASKLVNAAAGTQKLNADAQQQVIDLLAAEKAAMDARIEEAIQASAQNAPAEDDLAEQFTYRDVPGGVEILGFNEFEVGEELVIPETINRKPVIGVGQSAFENMTFYKVVLPYSIKWLGSKAFKGCRSLREINLPDRIRRIDDECFMETGLRRFCVPQEVRVIPTRCCCDCRNLKTVILHEGITEVSFNAFMFTAITKIVLPESVQFVKGSALYCGEQVIHIAVLGIGTDIANVPTNAIVYCMPGSLIQSKARQKNITIKPLSAFDPD